MSKTEFPAFHKLFPPHGERVAYDEAEHGAYAAKVPAELAAEWRQSGFGGYGDGLIWTPPPDEPLLDHEDWPGLNETAVQVLRTAFASVCVWQDGQFRWLNVHTGKIGVLGDDAPILFDASLTEADFRKKVLREPLFGKLRKRLGELSAQECYGFAPLPALGGDSSEEQAIKTPIREYIAMAAQVLG